MNWLGGETANPDLAAIVRVGLLAIAIILCFAQRRIENQLRKRPEHMELLQNLYRELSSGALISMALYLTESSNLVSRYNADVKESLENLHKIFLLAIIIYMMMCTTIMMLLKIVITFWKAWDLKTIQAEANDLMTLMKLHPNYKIQIWISKIRLAWLMYREIFLMQFVVNDESDSTSSSFAYVRYLRMAIYEVCLQLTDIRATAAIVILFIIAFRWTRVRFLYMIADAGTFGAIIWELGSLLYMLHINHRLNSINRDFMIDYRRFTIENLSAFQEKVQQLELKEVEQAHDTDRPRIVIDPPGAHQIRQQIITTMHEYRRMSISSNGKKLADHAATTTDLAAKTEQLVRKAAFKFTEQRRRTLLKKLDSGESGPSSFSGKSKTLPLPQTKLLSSHNSSSKSSSSRSGEEPYDESIPLKRFGQPKLPLYIVARLAVIRSQAKKRKARKKSLPLHHSSAGSSINRQRSLPQHHSSAGESKGSQLTHSSRDGSQRGYRNSPRRSLRKAEERSIYQELEQKRMMSLKEKMDNDSVSMRSVRRRSAAAARSSRYTLELISSFGGAKLENGRSSDLVSALKWWACPGPDGLLDILLITAPTVSLLAIATPVAVKFLLAPLLMQYFTMATSSGPLARVELIVLAIHQKLEEDAIVSFAEDGTRNDAATVNS